ncbi:Microtubule-associated protein 1A [Linum perenne]
MASKRIVLDTNNRWIIAVSDRTFRVLDATREVNTHSPPIGLEQWKEVARVGSNAASNHRELEVWGVVFSGKKLEELSTEIINHQVFVNREGFMLMYFNVGAPNMYLNSNGHKSLIRRHNDLFDWSKYGVNVPLPLGTVWDRFQLNTGKLMVDNKAAGEKEKENQKKLEEKEKENEKLKKDLKELEEEKKKNEQQQKEKDDQIEKQKKELEEKNKELEEKNKELEQIKKDNENKDKEIDELKAKQADDAEELKKLREDLAAKDKQIANLKNALQALL